MDTLYAVNYMKNYKTMGKLLKNYYAATDRISVSLINSKINMTSKNE